MVVFSLVCSALPVNPFGNVSSSVGADRALISWEYWGPEKNIYVEYKHKDSKQFMSLPLVGSERTLRHYSPVQVNRNFGSSI